MQANYTYWAPIIINVIFSIAIITIYGFLIYRAIKTYNAKALLLQQNLEEVKNQQEKLLLKTELEIQEQTFQFISKEIHDNVTQGLSLAKLNLNIIEIDNISESKILVHKSIDLISKALSDLNHLSKSLDSDLIESYGLIHAIKYEIERWQRLTKNDIELEVNGELQFLNTNSELLIFRIIQESINNIIKYAKAENIKITIHYLPQNIKISIQDDGIGFDTNTILTNKKIGEMAGLKNMRQRAESLEGKLTIESTPGHGQILNVIIPINNKISENDQNIALADDHKLLRNALATLIDSYGDCQVIMEANNGKDLCELVKFEQPDVAILDYNMPEMNGHECAEWLKENYPGVNVLMLTMYDTELMLIKLLQSGVKGFMKKDIHPTELHRAIHSVMTDGFYYSTYTSSKLAGFFRESKPIPFWEKLMSEQELSFMKLVCSEMTYKEIAQVMKMNPRTVDALRDSLFEKLEVKSRVGLAMYAIKHGLVAI